MKLSGKDMMRVLWKLHVLFMSKVFLWDIERKFLLVLTHSFPCSDVYDLCADYWDTVTDIPRPLNAPVSKNCVAAKKNTKKESSSSSSPLKRKRNSTSTTNKEDDEEIESEQVEPEQQDTKMNKKMKKSLDHVPQYMLERGFTFSSTWPNAKTKWNTDMKKFSAVQLSPTDKNVRMAYIEW